MSADFFTDSSDYEDISSFTGKERSASPKKIATKYGNGIFKNISGIIKVIAFLISIFVLLLFGAVAVFLAVMDSFFIPISIGIFIVGIILSAISLFLIYGTGHIIAQNDEILRRL